MAVLTLPLRKINLRPRLARHGKDVRTLEVERKFLPTEDSMARLRSNTRWNQRSNHDKPRFQSYVPLEPVRFHDIYLDKDNALMDQGIYVRLRNGKWEAKARQAGGFVNSQFAEYKGFEDVDALVQEAFGGRIEGQFLYSLHRIAEFSTRREKWDIAGFEVVVDETDFGHTVGEVELCEWVERQPEESDENHKRNIRAMGMMMDMRIEPFMKEHRQVFPPLPSGTHPKPVGKLSAYFAWKKKMEKREIMTNDEKGNGER